jgi:hypothetical protein
MQHMFLKWCINSKYSLGHSIASLSAWSQLHSAMPSSTCSFIVLLSACFRLHNYLKFYINYYYYILCGCITELNQAVHVTLFLWSFDSVCMIGWSSTPDPSQRLSDTKSYLIVCHAMMIKRRMLRKGIKIGTYPEKLSMLRQAAKLWIPGTVDLGDNVQVICNSKKWHWKYLVLLVISIYLGFHMLFNVGVVVFC